MRSKSSPREGQKGFRAPWKCVGFVPPSIALSLLMSFCESLLYVPLHRPSFSMVDLESDRILGPKDNLEEIEKTQLRIPPSFSLIPSKEKTVNLQMMRNDGDVVVIDVRCVPNNYHAKYKAQERTGLDPLSILALCRFKYLYFEQLFRYYGQHQQPPSGQLVARSNFFIHEQESALVTHQTAFYCFLDRRTFNRNLYVLNAWHRKDSYLSSSMFGGHELECSKLL
ncbi:unnamed protein product [Thlaspi arvense]|uniref:Uncharacterized protein n=1 Tax=Thlaspi arvense TaxID=13288 RepID=A0AAU9RNF0_THLAR|nr:unnamed protein product [Thlaspi arvense]